MRSAVVYRSAVFLLLAIAAGIVFFSTGEQSDSSPSRESRGPGAANIRPVARGHLPERKPAQESASGAAAAQTPAPAGTSDHAGRFAAAIAAAERDGSLNQPQARSATPQQAQDMLQKLMEEQARKEAVPLTSPFGESGQKERGR